MKRRWPKDLTFAQDGRHKREFIKRWISQGKRRTHKRERREGRQEARDAN